MQREHARKGTVTQIIENNEKNNYAIPAKLNREITEDTDLIVVTIKLAANHGGVVQRVRRMLRHNKESRYYTVSKGHGLEEGDNVLLNTELTT